MQLRAGDLRHVITIQQPVRVQALDGSFTETWSNFATGVRAMIQPASAREVYAQDQFLGEATHEITIRWRDGVTPKMRVVFGADLYDILGVVAVKDHERVIRLICKLGRSKGN